MHYKIGIIFVLLLIFSLNAFSIEEDEIKLEIDKLEKTDSELFEPTETKSAFLEKFEYQRNNLKEKGVDIHTSYLINSYLMRNNNIHSTKGTYHGTFNLSADIDTEKLHLFKGGKLHILYQTSNNGKNSLNFLNSYSAINGFAAQSSINQIGELYYEQSIKNDLLNIKIGKQDANNDFQALNTGFEFLNLSFSYIDNTPMPFVPAQQTGIRARIKLPKNIYIQDGFYDGNLNPNSTPKDFFAGENNYFNIAEIYKLTNFRGKYGKYMAGGWIKTGEYETFKNSKEQNNYGFYAEFEQKLTDRFEDKTGGLNIFGQFGYAKDTVNAIPFYYGLGLIFKGITQKRKDDSMGLAFAFHEFSHKLQNMGNITSEKVIELFYKIKITDYMYIQPDIQYIINPYGKDGGSFAIGIRSFISF